MASKLSRGVRHFSKSRTTLSKCKSNAKSTKSTRNPRLTKSTKNPTLKSKSSRDPTLKSKSSRDPMDLQISYSDAQSSDDAPSSDDEQQTVDICVDAFKSGNKSRNKRMVERLLPRIKSAVVRTTFESPWYFAYDTTTSAKSTVANVSLLHLAARWGWIDIAFLLVTEQNCSVEWKDDEGNIPLHYAAYYGHLELVKYFITELHCNPTYKNKLKNTPLHAACWNGCFNIVHYLISEAKCDPSCENISGPQFDDHRNIVHHRISEAHNNLRKGGDTPLHIACSNGHLNIVQYLISEAHCNPSCANWGGDTPLHCACHYGHLNIIQYLISEVHCGPSSCVNKAGETPLHYACRYGHHNIIQYLISEAHCNPSCVNKRNETPLHIACRYGHHKIVQYMYLFSEAHCKDEEGDTPLHIACIEGHLNIIQSLISEAHCNPSCVNSSGTTPLHYACNYGHFNIVQYLISEAHCNPSCVNSSGTTPLHYACDYGHFNVVQYLISEAHCNPSCEDNNGITPLHDACEKNHARIVQYLLSTGRVNPLAEDKFGDTPLSYATGKYDIIELLEPYADCSIDYPVHTFNKLILTGDSGAGKTTIAKHIDLASSTSRNFITRWLLPADQVTEAEHLTAGIVQYHIKGQLGNLVIYDFAGQQDYYSSHAAVLELVMRKSAAMFLCMIDLNKSKEMISESLQYWLTFIDNASSTAEGTSHIVIVGSHADQISSSKEKKEKISLLQEIAASRVKRQKYAGYVAMDCRYANTANSHQLISILTNSQKAITASQPAISYNCHVLYAFLCTELETVGCTLQHLISVINEENDLFFSKDPSVLTELLTILSDKGLILFIQRPESSWVFVKTEVLLKDINGTLFAPRHFKEYRDLASNTGIVPTSNLLKVFSQYDQEMLLSFLTSLDFCGPLDPSVLQYTNLQTTPSHTTGDLLFFPGLIQLERPDDLTQHVTLQFGWCLGCVEPNQFFGSRFLHLLLLSIAFRFPLVIQHNVSSSLRGLQRRCSVWKNGISWTDAYNITTVVELINKNRWVLVAMSCSEDRPVEHAKLRSALISLVHGLHQKQCPCLKVCEYLISPSLIQQYPLDDLPDTDLFDIQHVADSILCRKPSVLSQHIRIGSLPTQSLPLEPYHLISPSSVCQLFNSNMADQPVPVPILQEVQKHVCQPSKSPLVCKELRECLDNMSIFAGRNPLEVAGLKEEDLPTVSPPTSEDSSSCQNTQQSEEVDKLEKEELLIASPNASTTGDPSSILSIDDLADVKRFLKNVVDWQSLGLELGLLYPTLECIEEEKRGVVDKCKTKMLASWLQQQDNVTKKGVPSWSTLKTALENIGEKELVSEIS